MMRAELVYLSDYILSPNVLPPNSKQTLWTYQTIKVPQ